VYPILCVLGIELDGFAEALGGLFVVFQVVAQCRAEVVLGIGGFRIDFDRLPEDSDGLVQLPLVVQDFVEVFVSIADRRAEFDSL